MEIDVWNSRRTRPQPNAAYASRNAAIAVNIEWVLNVAAHRL